jgi:hypothetical protein
VKLEALKRKTEEIPDNGAVTAVYEQWRHSKKLADSIPTRLKFLNAPDLEPFLTDSSKKYVQEYTNSLTQAENEGK